MAYERDFAPLPAPEPRWRERLRQYWALVRGDRPIGWLLLLWPTWWGLWLAAGGVPPIWPLVVFSLGVWLTRWEVAPQGVFYQPNAWLALLLVAIVAGRIVLGFVQMAHYWQSGGMPATHALLSGHGSLLAVAGLLLGYYLVYAWGVKWRVARLQRLRGHGMR